jgi:hypothetical protein
VRVFAATFNRFPKAVPDRHHLIVFRVLDVSRKGKPLGVLCDKRREVLVHDIFETSAIAVERNWSGRGLKFGVYGLRQNDRRRECGRLRIVCTVCGSQDGLEGAVSLVLEAR